MLGPARWLELLRRRLVGAPRLPVWYHEAYRLPISELQQAVGIEPRRADLALWALLGSRNRRLLEIHEATRVAYGELQLVHTPDYLESLTRPAPLAAIFGLAREDFDVDQVMTTVRLACGGTLAAARCALERGGPAVNLLGGFHHAFPDKGGGLSPANDVAVALAVLRRDGFTGRCVVLDLDAHPPDGTAACLAHDARAWIGSISGSDWGPLPHGVDETVVPRADDATYLRALDALLDRAPRADLVFVLAGGDVLADDRMGLLALTLQGARARDERLVRWLGDTPAVWVPAGGYHATSWRVLAQTVGALLGPLHVPLPSRLDPVASRFAYVSRGLDPTELQGEAAEEPLLTQDELDALFGARPRQRRLLGFYTAEGVEYALYAFGFLPHLRRLGYGRFRVEIDRVSTGDRARLTGIAQGERHLLWEVVVSREHLDGAPMLYLNWMTMRHPVGSFVPGRPKLPGQEVPSLGMAEEAMQLLVRACERLRLEGILWRPAWFHTAWMARSAFRFVDPAVQGRFEGLQRDLGHVPLPELSQAVAEGRVRCDGAPYRWTSEPMVSWRVPRPVDEAAVAAARDACRFSIDPRPADPVPAR